MSHAFDKEHDMKLEQVMDLKARLYSPVIDTGKGP